MNVGIILLRLWTIVILITSFMSSLIAICFESNAMFNSITSNLFTQGLFGNIIVWYILHSEDSRERWVDMACFANVMISLLCFFARILPFNIPLLNLFWTMLVASTMVILYSLFTYVMSQLKK